MSDILKKAEDLNRRLATTPEQWEKAGELLDDGLRHPAFVTLSKAWHEVEKVLLEAKQRSQNLRRFGAGRTEDPTLVVSMIVPALREYAEEVQMVANQMERRFK